MKLRELSEMLARAGPLLPARVSVVQFAFFMKAAAAERAGSPLTVAQAAEGLTRSITTSYLSMLEADEFHKERLGLLRVAPDRQDQRRKHVHLTDAGRRLVDQIVG